MAQPVKLATPLDTVTVNPPVFVQLSTPDDGFVPIARVTKVALSPVSTLPLASSTATVTDGVIVALAAVLLGCCVYTSWVAAPTLMLKVLLAVVPCAGLLVASSV